MCFGASQGVQDDEMEMLGSSSVSVVHDKFLEMSSFDLALFKGHFHLLW